MSSLEQTKNYALLAIEKCVNVHALTQQAKQVIEEARQMLWEGLGNSSHYEESTAPLNDVEICLGQTLQATESAKAVIEAVASRFQ